MPGQERKPYSVWGGNTSLDELAHGALARRRRQTGPSPFDRAESEMRRLLTTARPATSSLVGPGDLGDDFDDDATLEPTVDTGQSRQTRTLELPNVEPPAAFRPMARRGLPEDYDAISASGLTTDREQPFRVLQEATGNLGPMMTRGGATGYGNVNARNASGRPSDVTMYGDPIDSEAKRLQSLQRMARESADINRMWLTAHLGPDTRAFRDDPVAAMKALGIGADAMQPSKPEPRMMTDIERGAVMRDFLGGKSAEQYAGHQGTVQSARTFMDPTVTQARGIQRQEAAQDAIPRIAQSLAGNEAAIYDPGIMRKFFGIDPGDQGGGDPAENVMSPDEFNDFAAENNMSPDEAMEYLRQYGIAVAR